MVIGVTGCTGFVGRHVIAAAAAAGHGVIGYSRSPGAVAGCMEVRRWQPIDDADFRGLDAIVHLAGENIFGLWTARKRAEIRRSRVDDTLRLTHALWRLSRPPRVLVSAGGTAWYGDRGEEQLPENATSGTGFLARVAHDWEAAACEAGGFSRVCILRTAMVLGRDGGAARVLSRVYRLGLGGRMGSGRQWWPWIHVDDLARMYLWAVETGSVQGAVNAAAPGIIRNAEFAAGVARVLHRPSWLRAPAFVLRALPGGMSALFLSSQKVIPRAALDAGFAFQFPDFAAAAQDVFAARAEQPSSRSD